MFGYCFWQVICYKDKPWSEKKASQSIGLFLKVCYSFLLTVSIMEKINRYIELFHQFPFTDIWTILLTYLHFRCHCVFLEHWNSQKSVCNIWQHFSCLLDEWIEKIWYPKNIFRFIRPVHVQLKTDKVDLKKKTSWKKKFCIFFQSTHQVGMKNVVKC